MGVYQEIISKIKLNEENIRKHFNISDSEWNNKIDKIPDANSKELKEDYLTFIVSCAFAICGNAGCYLLQKTLCEDNLPDFSIGQKYQIFFQASPLRGRSSPTFDLSFGDIDRIENRNSQIKYEPPSKRSGFIGLIEFKILDDITPYSKGNPTYNQLAKYIRSALIIQNSGEFPDEVHLTLVTPQEFKIRPTTRFYAYKFNEYANPTINLDQIKADIPSEIENEKFDGSWVNCGPESLERLSNLNLHWIVYEKILDVVPDSDLKGYLDDIRKINLIFQS